MEVGIMNSSDVVAAISRTMIGQTSVRPYGDGLLVDLALTYSDGDAVRVLVESMGTGYRVSDRGTAATLLSMAGVNLSTGRPAEAFANTMRADDLNGINAVDGELATFGAATDLGQLILNVAQASMRVEQLRWLAKQRSLVKFSEMVVERVRDWVVDSRRVQREAPVPLRSGRSRSVTLCVSSGDRAAYIQAVGSSDKEQAAEHCYYVFDLSEVPKEHRIAALRGGKPDWPPAIVSELATVSDVAFFDAHLDLERRLDLIVPPLQPTLA
jgi:hypothetical protein